jgi:cytoskeletal protein CcmA (bactofilin family)
MDPTKSQPETGNEANSLEATDTVVETAENGSVVDASNTSAIPRSTENGTPGGPPPHKMSPFKRFWHRFNIYLLLFILVILIAIGVTIGLFLKDNNTKKASDVIIGSQNLSDSALKQLANSDVTVGNDRQILKVESNAIFSGSVLVRNDLEVAGTIKVGGELQLPGITVSGTSRFSQLQADNMTIGSNATVQGTFIVKKGMSVTGNSTFDGISAAQITTNAFQLNGELKLTNHIVAGGPSPGVGRGTAVGSGGTASVSGSDTTGSVVVNTGSNTGAGCFATITFARKFSSTPHVVITPIGSGAAAVEYYVNRSSSEFSICTTNAAPSGQTFGFDYVILN